MNYFAKELWAVLTRPFKLREGGECHKWVKVLGSLLDDLRECMLALRRYVFIKYAPDWVLEILGFERDIPRWQGESIESYRQRVLGAFALYAAGGTKPGMQKALLQIGYGEVAITERSGPTWSHFLLAFEFTFGRTMGRLEWDILHFSVWSMKPAHTMPRYLLSYRSDPPQRLPISCKPRLYGAIKANHTIWLGSAKFYPINGSLQLDGSIKLGDGWCRKVYIDGEFIEYVAIDENSWKWRDNPLHRASAGVSALVKRPFVNKTIYRLDGSERLKGFPFLDALRGANTNLANHNTFVEFFDENGISQGKEALQ